MDTLGAHETDRVRELIEAEGCAVWYQPPYSPDLSPIGEAFSELEQLLRKAEARTLGPATWVSLEAALVGTLDAITAGDARGYFTHRG